MSAEIVTGHCYCCHKDITIERPRVSHGLHAVLIIITAGVWLIPLIILLIKRESEACPYCGAGVRVSATPPTSVTTMPTPNPVLVPIKVEPRYRCYARACHQYGDLNQITFRYECYDHREVEHGVLLKDTLASVTDSASRPKCYRCGSPGYYIRVRDRAECPEHHPPSYEEDLPLCSRCRYPLRNDLAYCSHCGCQFQRNITLVTQDEYAAELQSYDRLKASATLNSGIPSRGRDAFEQAAIETKHQLDAMRVIAEPSTDMGVVQIGSRVTIEDEGEVVTYQIVGPHRSRLSSGTLACKSPLAAALLGHTAPDTVVVSAPGGTRSIRIITVRP